jgi:hypothetical protein
MEERAWKKFNKKCKKKRAKYKLLQKIKTEKKARKEP